MSKYLPEDFISPRELPAPQFEGVFDDPAWEVVAAEIVSACQVVGNWIPYVRPSEFSKEYHVDEMMREGLLD